MAIKIGINGYGRIGRNILRAIHESGRAGEFDVVALNDLGDPTANARLTRRDTAHGAFPGTVDVDGGDIIVNGDRVKVFAERDPAKLPWGDLGVDVVFECTGLFRTADTAGKHIDGGAKKVVISAPGGEGVRKTIVYGVNHDTLTADDQVISNASCTTNCLAPLVKPLHDELGVKHGIMTTIHAYTNDQVLTDVYHKDPRRARSGTMSQIPTSTGAAKAVGLVLPELNGKLDGFSMRVPTINVSCVDLTFAAARDTSVDEVNDIIRAAANGPLKGVLAYCDEPLVSIDFNHDPHSSTVDTGLTKVMEGNMVKVLSWYDNEWGFLKPHARYHRCPDERQLGTSMAVNRMTDLALSGKRVLIREDLNVPISDGEVASDARIRAALPTLRAALDAGAAVMVMSHLGRPTEGKPDGAFSLQPVADYLAGLLDCEVPLIKNWIDGVDVEPGNIVLCENVRFLAGEKACDEVLARKMASLCDVFVMDAFGTAHRAQASTYGVAEFAPVACAGPLLAAELARTGAGHGQSRAPVRCYCRWLQSVDQTHGTRCAGRQGRHPDRRRRYRQHLHCGCRTQGR